MHMQKTFVVGALTLLLFLSFTVGVLANGTDTHPTGEMHDGTIQTTDRSAQLPNTIGGFVIGVVIGIILARFIFKKS